MTTLFIGLGNPGSGYADTRHNIGFMIMDAMHARYGISGWGLRKGAGAVVADAEIGYEAVLLVKPQTYMNSSGDAVKAVLDSTGMTPGNMVVFHDELDLPFLHLRMKTGGRDAGHRGIRSIDAAVGAEYRRCRIGIGRPGGEEKVDVVDYVLSPFTAEERPAVATGIEDLVGHIGLII